MIASLRYTYSRWKLRRIMRPIEREIAKARRLHKPVKHLIQARQDLIHWGLRGAR